VTPLECVINRNFGDFSNLKEWFPKQQCLQEIEAIHRAFPGYEPTPLYSLQGLSKSLDLGAIYVKDEGRRFGLKAFKALGAAYAVSKLLLKDAPPAKTQEISLAELRGLAKTRLNALVTATDGNHGKGVAWVASQLGVPSYIFMPKGSVAARVESIAQFATRVEVTELNYDQTVQKATEFAKEIGAELIQDTSWSGYESIPADILRGYWTIGSELQNQIDDSAPTHWFLQAGVGTFAAAMALFAYSQFEPAPKIILIEPYNADCFYRSLSAQQKTTVNGDLNTIMAGLACGQPSMQAWQILRHLSYASIRCEDQLTLRGMQRYANPVADDPKIVAGESAAVSLGVLQHIMNMDQQVKETLGLDGTSRVMLISTEADTDPQFYRRQTQTDGKQKEKANIRL